MCLLLMGSQIAPGYCKPLNLDEYEIVISKSNDFCPEGGEATAEGGDRGAGCAPGAQAPARHRRHGPGPAVKRSLLLFPLYYGMRFVNFDQSTR